jgi:phospholipase D1/2
LHIKHDIGGCVFGKAARDVARHFIQRWNYVKMKKVRKNKHYPLLLPKALSSVDKNSSSLVPASLFDPAKLSTCKVQVLRSVSNWSAGQARTESSIHEAMKHLIKTAEHYIYIENQFFISLIDDKSIVRNELATCLYDRILRAHKEKQSFKVYILIPLVPGYEGEYGKSSSVLLHTITHYNNASVNGLMKKLSDANIDALNYICFFALRTWSELSGRLVTELIYVHSKLIIVDDRRCIIGSANINDRSLLGNRDSEIALYIEDEKLVPGVLNKNPCQVGCFVSSLRKRLFQEFLGEYSQPPNKSLLSASLSTLAHVDASLASSPASSFAAASNEATTRKYLFNLEDILRINLLINEHQQLNSTNSNNYSYTSAQTIDITDPCSDEFYKQVLLTVAAQNTRVYDLVNFFF